MAQRQEADINDPEDSNSWQSHAADIQQAIEMNPDYGLYLPVPDEMNDVDHLGRSIVVTDP